MTQQFKSDFLNVLQQRGFVHQCTDLSALDQALLNTTVSAYVGYDCTADSLHVGSLISIMMLRHLQKSGHRPIVLMGGGTTRVGDPSGRDESRQLLTDDIIASNMAGIQKIFANYLAFGKRGSDAVMVNNADWLDKLEYIPFLRDVGRHFSINRMMTMDSVKSRLEREQPLTFLEFNYMILQSYDFLELNRRYGCALQMGGSDQWGNIIGGVELVRRIDHNESFGLTCPLLTTASGAKMGKTASGAVWLNAERMSAYDFWQYWRNTEDADVGRFLKLFTEMPLDEIAKLEKLGGSEINEAKKILATAVTTLCHGEGAALAAEATAQQAFESGHLGGDIPRITVQSGELVNGALVYELLCRAGIAASNSEARRLIKSGGVKINDVAVHTEMHKITDADLNAEGHIKLSSGKKKHVLIALG